MKRLGIAGALVLCGVAAGTPALGQQSGSRQAREFVLSAAQADNFEIIASQAALVQSSNPQVRAFAQQIINAHRRTLTSLRDAATRSGIEPPGDAIAGDQAMLLAAMQDAHSPNFDRVYARSQVLVHQGALTTSQGFAMTGEDHNLRATAALEQRVIEGHLSMAQRLLSQISDGG